MGIPLQIVSDNGPQFISSEFRLFCRRNCIKHIKSTPYHSRTNGLAERTIRTIKERYFRSKDVKEIDERLIKVLQAYRNTIHSSTQRTPAEVIFNFPVRNVLDNVRPSIANNAYISMSKQRNYKNIHCTLREFNINEPVWVYNTLTKKFEHGIVVKRTGYLSYLVKIGERILRKHADHLRLSQYPPKNQVNRNEDSYITFRDDPIPITTQIHNPTPEPSEIIPRRSERLKYKQKVCYRESSDESLGEEGHNVVDHNNELTHAQ
ncbi:Gag-Pro-Pol polyprotein [Thelohanellus kitauei]|uniref:Gag-Pro-Pol polyprotein n=2 Tax=Thelohanellus kitauei TaxID=669202 RepID=A0A0C2N5I7_THEKT|nr:Gag-Pro-Pol polyprotein [Thelohanellus kitauei]